MNKIIILLFLNILPSVITNSKVSIFLENEVIVFGATTSLLCIFDDSLDLNNNKNREWGGGLIKNEVLSFEGKLSLTNKYREDTISTRKFRLNIFNTSEADVNCHYGCYYGFSSSTLYLNIKKIPYIYTPKHIKKEIKQENKSIYGNIFLKKIYPPPTCKLSAGISRVDNFSNVFYQVDLIYQITINYTQEDNCITNDTIRCFIKIKETVYWEEIFIIAFCNYTNNNFKDENNKLSMGIGITVIVLFCVCNIIMIILLILSRRKRRKRRKQEIKRTNYQLKTADFLENKSLVQK